MWTFKFTYVVNGKGLRISFDLQVTKRSLQEGIYTWKIPSSNPF